MELNIKTVNYAEMVGMLVKPGQVILDQLTAAKANIWHLATGVCGEAGELLDAVKKHVAYNKPIDRQNVIEELGDMEFYMEGVRQEIGVTREEVLNFNIEKLAVRYKNLHYTDEAAHARADKQ